MNEGWCLSVRPSVVCRVPRPNSRMERPRNPEIGMMEAHHTSNSRTYLNVKRSKVKVIKRINGVTDNATLRSWISRDAEV